jgi:hypothetical protein
MSGFDEDKWMFNTLPDTSSSSKPDIKSRIGSFVKSDSARQAIHSTATKVMGYAKEHHKAILASAVTAALTHGADIDIPNDLEEQLHHHIEHLGTSLSISKTMAHGALLHAVGKLRELRGLKEDKTKDDELDRAIVRLHEMLKKIAPKYNPPKPKAEK